MQNVFTIVELIIRLNKLMLLSASIGTFHLLLLGFFVINYIVIVILNMLEINWPADLMASLF